MSMQVQSVTLPESQRKEDEVVEYTHDSLKAVVIAVAHLLDHYADKDHPALSEPQNLRRRMANTSVLVYPKAGGHMNRVGYQLFVRNPVDELMRGGGSSTVGVIFDMRVYEQMGDKYLFNMLKKLTESIRASHRPSADELKALSTRFMLEN